MQGFEHESENEIRRTVNADRREPASGIAENVERKAEMLRRPAAVHRPLLPPLLSLAFSRQPARHVILTHQQQRL